MNKPKIFISSTIQDFRDLRSALRYYLSNLGYEVYLSEYNDFKKSLDKTIFDNCLSTIEDCDYYILLIGTRVGGFIDTINKISITQAEYRKAYEKMKSGKLKIVVFTRKEVWDAKEERNSLKDILESEYLKKYEIDEKDKESILNYKSDLFNDAEFIQKFIFEVRRADEMDKASKGEGEYPTGNWLHMFNSFQDIADVLNIEFHIKKDVGEIALIEMLKKEILSNIKILLTKEDGKIYRYNTYAFAARHYFRGDLSSKSRYPKKVLVPLMAYVAVGMGRSGNLSVQMIDHALKTGYFLEYDKDMDKFKTGIVVDNLLKLKKYIENLQYFENILFKDRVNLIDMLGKLTRYIDVDDVVSVDNSTLSIPFIIYDIQNNIIELLIALIKYFDGDNNYLENIKLVSSTPFEGMEDRIKKETPTNNEVIEWIKSQK